MKKIAHPIRLSLWILLLLALIFGVYLSNVNKVLLVDGICDITVSSCKFEALDQVVSVSFEQKPVPEEELSLNITLPERLEIQTAWVEGINMYMGKSPVIFENPSNAGEGIVFLGSCNLSEMQWRLLIEFSDTQSNERSQHHFIFTTSLD